MRKIKKIIFMLVVLVSLGIATHCYADYYWTVQTSTDKSMETLKIGQKVDVTYIVMVGISSVDQGECVPCAIPAVMGQCVEINDDQQNVLGQVCASRNMQPAFFRYTKTIGPYDECGYYTVESSVSLEPVVEAVPLESEGGCCDNWTIYVKVPCEPVTPPEYEGCSKGYWKNHTEAWEDTGYMPDDKIGDIFTLPRRLLALENDTLLMALKYKGGPKIIDAARLMLRQAVAALLNAAHPDIYYPATPERVILNVNDTLDSLERPIMMYLGAILDHNNNKGCPLDDCDDD